MNALAAAVPARPRPFALVGVRRDQDGDAAAGEIVHLVVVSVTGIGDHHLRLLGHPGGGELALGGGDHRFEVA
jgi:hypothetical protein